MFFPDFDSVDQGAVPDDAQQNPDPDDLPPHCTHEDPTLDELVSENQEPVHSYDDVHDDRLEDVRDPALCGPAFICPDPVDDDDTACVPGSDTEPETHHERADIMRDPGLYGHTFICPDEPGDTDSFPGSDTSQPEPGPSHSIPVTLNELDVASFCSSCHNEIDIDDEILGVQPTQREESFLDASGDSQRTDTRESGRVLETVQEECSSSSSNHQSPDPALRPSLTKDRDLCSKCFSEVLLFKRVYILLKTQARKILMTALRPNLYFSFWLRQELRKSLSVRQSVILLNSSCTFLAVFELSALFYQTIGA